MVEGNLHLEQEVCVAAGCPCPYTQLVEMHVTDWAEVQREDLWNFKSSITGEMCKLLGVKKLRTMPYHPQSTGW